jgi:DNA-binding winged helix-turn-helix (wHTH) protein/tetratricopeptide (TPR) repeat protein
LKKLHLLPVLAPVEQTSSSESAPLRPVVYSFGPFRLTPIERSLRRGDHQLHLPPKAIEALVLLVENAGHLMRKEDLMQALWPNTFVEDVNLANKISLLRKVLEDKGPDWKYIETVAKMGYRFRPEVIHVVGSSTGRPAVNTPPRPLRFMALPFEVVHGDGDMAFLAHSLPEAVAGSLAGLRSLTVRSSLLAAKLADSCKDPRQIGVEADVDLLLSGTIYSSTTALRVRTEVIDARSATLLASFCCDSSHNDFVGLQENLVHWITQWLPSVDRNELSVWNRDIPASSKGFEFYLRGMHIERERTFTNICIARDLYRQSLEDDPNYAPAWARLGRCYRFLEKFDPDRATGPELTEWAFGRAFSLNPDLPIAHNHYTQIQADSGQAVAAMVRLLNQAGKYPNNPDLFCGLVQASRYCGQLEVSLQAHGRARTLDSKAVTSVAHTYFLLGDYDRVLEWYPPGLRYYLDAAALAAAGREKEAAMLLRERIYLSPLVNSLLCILEGDTARSIAIVKTALADPQERDPEMQFYLARHLSRSGAAEGALRLVLELSSSGFVCSTAMQRDPWFKELSTLAGYEDVLQAVLDRESECRSSFENAGGARVLGPVS